MMLNSLVVSALLIGGTVISTASPYEGVYRGTVSLSENYEYYGFEGIFVGHIDSRSQATLWIGNDEEAYKVSFKVNPNGQGKFIADGIKISLSFGFDGGIIASSNSGRDLSFNSTKISYADRMGSKLFYGNLRSKAAQQKIFYFPSDFDQPDWTSTEKVRDRSLLMFGEWQLNSAKVVSEELGRVTMTGDVIILPDSIYLFGKIKGTQTLMQQDPFASDYSSAQLHGATLNWTKKQISAKVSDYVQGYYATVDYTITQKTSYYDSDGDGLSNHAEITETLTDPFKADTDGDKVGDADELSAGTDPLNRLEFPAKLSISISTAKGKTPIPSMVVVTIDGTDYDVPLTKGKGTQVLFLPTGKSYEISASSANWSSGAPQQLSLKKATTLRVQLKPGS